MNIKIYEEIDSTQLEAKRINEHKTVIIAKRQTNGIGTHGRKWYNGEKGNNIAMTIILHPNCNISKLKNITIEIAQIILEVLSEYEVYADIKEPNDIMLNGKKLAGILVETNLKGEMVSNLFIGIGININQIEFPIELEQISTSLKKEFNKNYDVKEIIDKIIKRIDLLA